MSNIVKFQSLELNHQYEVKSYSELFKTDYGDCYVLLISEEESDETFELYANKYVNRIFRKKKPEHKFSFTVTESKGKKYPIIEGYIKKRNWTHLE